jgi:Ca-activated chloride channel family protein
MTSLPDYYALLGIPRDASLEDVRRAYRKAAMRLHPDVNQRPGDTEFFLEVTKGYEILSDPDLRSDYDQRLVIEDEQRAAECPFEARVLHSKRRLYQLSEPQVHYLHISIYPGEEAPTIRPRINLGIIIDRSTSMRGERLDQVRSATNSILKQLDPRDSATILSFSDRAELVLSPEEARRENIARARLSLLRADGGTEIAQGLRAGLDGLQPHFSRGGVNHVILLTDGHTYGDETECLAMANEAADEGITINAVGIGTDWSDRFLDQLASRTGGYVVFLDTPGTIKNLFNQIVASLEHVAASRVTLGGSFALDADLRSAFRLTPDPMPLPDTLPLILGNLPAEGEIELILEVVIQPIMESGPFSLGDLFVLGDVLSPVPDTRRLSLDLGIEVSRETDPEDSPQEIISALGAITLYRIQEKARYEAEIGEPERAARRLERLATHLLASDEKALAHTALREAERLTQSLSFSDKGGKILKYGTRALLLPAPVGSP